MDNATVTLPLNKYEDLQKHIKDIEERNKELNSLLEKKQIFRYTKNHAYGNYVSHRPWDSVTEIYYSTISLEELNAEAVNKIKAISDELESLHKANDKSNNTIARLFDDRNELEARIRRRDEEIEKLKTKLEEKENKSWW